MTAKSSDALMLIHGLGAHWLIMVPLARRLKRQFGRVINWGYSSLWSRMEFHGRRMAARLRELDEDPTIERIHLVTHSMGGIVARLALAEGLPRKMGRMVMVAPPNTGSHAARLISPVFGRLCPPLVQLSDRAESFVVTLPPPPNLEIGIIAARHDFLVFEPRTHLPSEQEHIILPGLHSSVVWRRETAEQAAAFLASGKFAR